MTNGDWGLGIGDWGLGIGPNPQSPIPNPQSPIPNINYELNNIIFKLILYIIIIYVKSRMNYCDKINKKRNKNNIIISKYDIIFLYSNFIIFF